ncbi:MAG: SRPBCC family protein [Sinimarinibacterium sp.]|jgi:carbon monoxide dehydrogenase subunit G
MIEAQHAIIIRSGIGEIWNYVQDIERWAHLFPGCRECAVKSRDESDWTIKVGAGGLMKTVVVQVQVQEWAEPDGVRFAFRLASDPVQGTGRYRASRKGTAETEICLELQVQGSGQMAPMWEAVSRPLLPQLARAFAENLRAEIEGLPRPTFRSRFVGWLRSLWQKVLAFRASPAS